MIFSMSIMFSVSITISTYIITCKLILCKLIHIYKCSRVEGKYYYTILKILQIPVKSLI